MPLNGFEHKPYKLQLNKLRLLLKLCISICWAGPRADTGAGVGRRAPQEDVLLDDWDGCVGEHHSVS
jgi:hypothetical protein